MHWDAAIVARKHLQHVRDASISMVVFVVVGLNLDEHPLLSERVETQSRIFVARSRDSVFTRQFDSFRRSSRRPALPAKGAPTCSHGVALLSSDLGCSYLVVITSHRLLAGYLIQQSLLPIYGALPLLVLRTMVLPSAAMESRTSSISLSHDRRQRTVGYKNYGRR